MISLVAAELAPDIVLDTAAVAAILQLRPGTVPAFQHRRRLPQPLHRRNVWPLGLIEAALARDPHLGGGRGRPHIDKEPSPW